MEQSSPFAAPTATAIDRATDQRELAAHWAVQGQPWRTEPEIDADRQQTLSERLATPIDILAGRFPFAEFTLTRADIEWLLATHEDGRGPVIWAHEPVRIGDWGVDPTRVRWGLDLRGAMLAGVDLRGLPLARLRAGLTAEESWKAPFAQVESMSARAGANLSGADLRGAQLHGAVLRNAMLDDADLRNASLDYAQMRNMSAARTDWRGAKMDQLDFTGSSLGLARFTDTDLRSVTFGDAQLRGADLTGANLTGVNCKSMRLREITMAGAQAAGANFQGQAIIGVNLRGANLRGANFQDAHLSPVTDWSYLAQAQRTLTNDLTDADLSDATFDRARLQDVLLDGAQLAGASLVEAHLEGVSLVRAQLVGADLRRATFDGGSNLQGVRFGDGKRAARFFGVAWNDADLSAVDWSRLTQLGDETAVADLNAPADRAATLAALAVAVRAYRQHALTLRGQALGRQAAPFDYRGQVLQRKLLWRRIRWEGKIGQLGAWFFSLFLGALTGYGYRMWRVLLVYALVIVGCAAAYFALGAQVGPHLSPAEALLVSVTAFHGRVFSEQFGPGSPQLWVTAIEAIAGLIVEGVFIAMLTQRFFNR